MKQKKAYIIVLLFSCIFAGLVAGGASDIALGVVVKDTIQFYDLESQTYLKEYDFNLPKGYKDVFGYQKNIAVVFNDKIEFYDLETKKYIKEWDFSLPKGHKNVFALGNTIAYALNNIVEGYDPETKKYIKEWDFSLPKGYESFIPLDLLFTFNIGKIEKNILYMYDPYEKTEGKALELPKGYRDIFTFYFNIGVVVKDVVEVYSFAEKEMFEKEFDFPLPKGHKKVFAQYYEADKEVPRAKFSNDWY